MRYTYPELIDFELVIEGRELTVTVFSQDPSITYNGTTGEEFDFTASNKYRLASVDFLDLRENCLYMLGADDAVSGTMTHISGSAATALRTHDKVVVAFVELAASRGISLGVARTEQVQLSLWD